MPGQSDAGCTRTPSWLPWPLAFLGVRSAPDPCFNLVSEIHRDEQVRVARQPQHPGSCTAGSRLAGDLPGTSTAARPFTPTNPAYTAPCDRELLALACLACGSARSGTGVSFRSTRRMDVADRNRNGSGARCDVSAAALSLPRACPCPRTRALLYLWSAGLPLRLAQGSLERRHAEQKCQLACGLRNGLEVMGHAE